MGKTPYDQDFADKAVEAGVAACGFPRPQPRPVGFDEPSRAIVAAPVPAKKPSLIQRSKASVKKLLHRAPGVVTPVGAAPLPQGRPFDLPVVEAEPEPAATPPPASVKRVRSPVEELLDPE